MNKKFIVWFRNDLRIQDNPALQTAINHGEIMPIYIYEEKIHHHKNIGSASKWWLHHSLNSLNKSLKNSLNIYVGDAQKILSELINKHQIAGVFWNRRYEPLSVANDSKIKKFIREQNIICDSFNGSLLWEPHEVLKSDNTPYKVFTHFYRKGCLQSTKAPRLPTKTPENFAIFHDKDTKKIDDLQLLPTISWDKTMQKTWQIGEKFAYEKMQNFVKTALGDYKIGRDFPAQKKVSQLSPHLHFGEISPNQIWHYAKQNYQEKTGEKNLDSFLSELGWREFSAYLLFHFPNLPSDNFQPRYNHFKWQSNHKLLTAWQKGQTGLPIVDAGMRELWQTGYMHNRVRMIVGSFLVKNLLIDWREGEKWFWDCLVDADLASNCASWQWVAGSGADAAPYFRIFNPILQGEKFDPEGEYTKKFVPELKNLPAKYLFKPFEAPAEVLKSANIRLGIDYPLPIIDLEKSRNLALETFKSLPKIFEEDLLK
jgi:deoxyribodipyrimidine photo-lyase